MIEYALLIMLGFCAAGLLAMLFAPSLWNRAVRLTTKRMEATMPMSLSDIEADKDLLRAAYAIQIRRLQAALNGMRDKSAGQLVEISKLQMTIGGLKDQIAEVEKQLDERRNAANVYESTIRKRFPELEGSLATARTALEDRAYELEDLQSKLRRRDEALSMAQRSARLQQNEITLLRGALEKASNERSGRFKARPTQWGLEDYRAEYDRLNLEMSRMREQLALSYEREKGQNAVLKAELQQLGERIMTTLATQHRQAAALRPAEKPSSTEVPVRRDVRERRNAVPRPWPSERAKAEADQAAVEPNTPARPGGATKWSGGVSTAVAEQRKKAPLNEPVPQPPFMPGAGSSPSSSPKDDQTSQKTVTPPELQALFDRTAKPVLRGDAEGGDKGQAGKADAEALQEAIAIALEQEPEIEDAPLAQPEPSVAEALAAARNSGRVTQEPPSIEPALDRVVKEMFEGDSQAASPATQGQATDASNMNAEAAAEQMASPETVHNGGDDQLHTHNGTSEEAGEKIEKKDTLLSRLSVMQERQTG